MDWHRIILAFLITLLIHYSNHMVRCDITDVQLVGGPSSNKGTVEIRQDGGDWETTCGINLDINDVIVICKQLGFPGASLALQITPFIQNSIPDIRLDCNGDEGNVAACPSFSHASGCSQAGAASCHGERYLGCFKDDSEDRVLSSTFVFNSPSMNISYCILLCQGFTTANYVYAGVESGNECSCGVASDNYARHGVGVDSNCSLSCHGDPTESCGGVGYIAIFRTTSPLTTTSIVPSTNQEVTTNGGRISTPSSPPSPSPSSSSLPPPSSSSTSTSSSSSSLPPQPSSSSSSSSLLPPPPPSSKSTSSSSSSSSPSSPSSSTSSSSSPSSISSSSSPPSSSSSPSVSSSSSLSSSPTEPQRTSNLPTAGNSTVLYAGIGGGVAAVVIIIIVIVAIVCFTKRRSQQRKKGIASSQMATLTQASRPPEYEEINDFGIPNGVMVDSPSARGFQPRAQAHSSANSSKGDKNVLLVNLNPRKSSNIYEGTMDETQDDEMTPYTSSGTTDIPQKSNDRLSVLYAKPDKNGNGAQDGYDEINLGITPYSSFENSEQPTASAKMADRMSVVYAAPDKNHERNVTSEDMDSRYAMPDKNGNRNPSDDTSEDVGSLYAMPDKSRRKPDGRDGDQDPYAKYNDSFSGDQYNEMEMVENELYTM